VAAQVPDDPGTVTVIPSLRSDDLISIGALSHPVAILNLDLTLRSVNAAYLEVFPFRAEDILGGSIYRLADRALNEGLFEALESSSVDGRRRVIRNPSGDFGRIFDNIISPMPDCLVVETRDVTQSVADEEALRVQDSLRDHIFARNHDLVALVDFVAPAVRTNDSFRNLLGDLSWVETMLRNGLAAPDEMTAQDFALSGAPALLVGLHAELMRVWTTGHDYRFSGVVPTLRDPRTLSVTVTRWDFDGQPRGIAMVGSDLTELVESRRRAEQALHVQRFAQAVAHDFGNIAQVVGGFAQMLALDPTPDVVAAASASLARSAERAVAVSQRIATVARLQYVANSRIDLADLIRRHHGHLQSVAGPRVIVGIEAAGSALVVANADQLLSAVENLCHNASRAMGGTGEIRIGVSVDPMGRCVVLEVSDCGPGLPPQIRDNLFEPFNSSTTTAGGTGLGLYLLREYVTSIGGTISVDTGGHGTTVTLRLECA
jgi:signal transduction histidine kinase